MNLGKKKATKDPLGMPTLPFNPSRPKKNNFNDDDDDEDMDFGKKKKNNDPF